MLTIKEEPSCASHCIYTSKFISPDFGCKMDVTKVSATIGSLLIGLSFTVSRPSSLIY